MVEVPSQPGHHLQEVQPGEGHATGRTTGALGEEGGPRVRLSQDQAEVILSHPRQRLRQKEGRHCGERQHSPRMEGGMEAEDEEIPEEVQEILS